MPIDSTTRKAWGCVYQSDCYVAEFGVHRLDTFKKLGVGVFLFPFFLARSRAAKTVPFLVVGKPANLYTSMIEPNRSMSILDEAVTVCIDQRNGYESGFIM